MIKRKTCVEEDCTQPVWARKRCKYHDSIHHPEKHGFKSSDGTSPKKEPMPKKRKRIAPVSEKQAQRLKEYRKLRDAYLKVNDTCEFPGCASKDVTLHHGAGRTGDLLTDANYFVALCFKHHRFVEENPAEAKGLGLSYDRLGKWR